MLELLTDSNSSFDSSISASFHNVGSTLNATDLISPSSATNSVSGAAAIANLDEALIQPNSFLAQSVDTLALAADNSASAQVISTDASIDEVTGQPVSDVGVAQLDNLAFSTLNYTAINTQLVDLQAATDPNGTFATADPLGTLTTTLNTSGTIGYNESHGRDNHDFWKFSVTSDMKVNLSLSNLSADSGLALYNSAGQLLTWSNKGNNASESISRWLGTGDYYALVYNYQGWGGSTSYSLGFQAGTKLNSVINDYSVHAAVSDSIKDGIIDRTDMINVLRSTKDWGAVDSWEVGDLRDILNDANAFGLADHVRVLGDKVVNGNVANIRSGIGNLFAGSSATQMESLVGKWFLGNDRPDASGTYQKASGSLFQNGINFTDVNQGGVGDCYFMATLAAAAKDKPSAIQNMFIDNGDDTFTVRLFNNGKADYVTVDKYLPTSFGNAVYAGWGGGSYNEANNELWVALAEKAYAQFNESGWIGQDNTNSYAGLDGGWMAPVMEQITALDTSSKYVSSLTQQTLIDLTNSDKLLTVGFVHGGGHGVVNMHAYTITSYNAATQTFHLNNPWGSSHVDVTWAQLQDLKGLVQWTNT
ncbi:MAG TPA: C2 family cysteine protease [Coleofasciculaceae cyanobacterium]